MGSRGKRITLGIAVAASLAILGTVVYVWHEGQPKIQFASVTEIRATVPQELLLPLAVDAKSQERMAQLIEVCNSLQKSDLDKIQDAKAPVPFRIQLAQRLFDFPKLGAIAMAVDAGDVQVQEDQPPGNGSPAMQPSSSAVNVFEQIHRVEGALGQSANMFLDANQHELAVECMLVANRLKDREWSLRGQLIIHYLMATANEARFDRIAQTFALNPAARAGECARILRDIHPAPTQDQALANAVKLEFETNTIPQLANPFPEEKQAIDSNEDPDNRTSDFSMHQMSYSAIETAKVLGKVAVLESENAGRTYKDHDWTAAKLRRSATLGLPQEPSREIPPGIARRIAWLKYQYAANRIPNCYGRMLTAYTLSDENLHEISCRWRTSRELTRIALASRIYREGHGGALPKTRDLLVPILGSWPKDPFDGEPMRYNAEKQVAYSVGKKLKDDGGNWKPNAYQVKDVGITLRIGAKI